MGEDRELNSGMAKQRANKTVHGLNRTRNVGQPNFLYQCVQNDDETNSK